ncbi:DUF3857 domain-containing protein [Flagellimonas pacifica]|uniref:DUF3857 domain-containing protein n=1 Tax=Flagellimonas pacifica TaxID=1247520 RepID=A0A285MUK7_9FLAO|nr:DUF3857 domain-containing protein [Allomuricauda parva]SNZ00855.1 protein of unknown function [Allomuricauda parva]
MKKVLFFLAFLIVQSILAQDHSFGKVSKEELEEKFNPADSSASATYLYKYRKTHFEYLNDEGFQLLTEVHERIKIYNKEGLDYATKKINLYKNSSAKEKVGMLKASTYNLVDGKIEAEKLKKDGEFETELNKYYNQKSFTMPKAKEGSVIEYKYRIISPFVFNVDEFVFQHDIPIKKLNAIMEAPEYFSFRVNMKGFLNITPKVSSKNGKIQIKNRVRQSSQGYSLSGGNSVTKFSTSNIDYKIDTYHYDFNNVPTLKEEPYVNNIDNYRSGVKYELSYIKYPNSGPKFYSTTWEDVIKTIYDSSNFGSELNKTNYYKEDLNTFLLDVTDNDKKIELILDFVKSKVKWNDYNGKYTTSGGVRKAYKEQTGNVAEINLMLTSMLRYAGFNANPVLVSTRTNGIPLFPTREGYNYVICAITEPNNVTLLDASSQFSTPNVLPFRTLNWEGRIIKKEGTSKVVDLYPKTKSMQKIFVHNTLEENGDLNGKIRILYKDHDALKFRNEYLKADQEDYLVGLEEKNGGLEISNFNVKNEQELSKPVMVSYDFYRDGAFEKIGERIYISPLFFLTTSTNPFTLEKREYPVDFGYPSGKDIISTVKIPVGFQIESLPEPMVLLMPDGLGQIRYNIQGQGDDSIQLKVVSEINQAIITPMYYDTLKDYYKKMIEKLNEKVVLSKI